MDKDHDEHLYNILSGRRSGLEKDIITDNILLNTAEDVGPKSSRRVSIHSHDISGSSTTSSATTVRPDKARCEIHERYTKEVEDPQTKRTVRTYLSKIEQHNHLMAKEPNTSAHMRAGIRSYPSRSTTPSSSACSLKNSEGTV